MRCCHRFCYMIKDHEADNCDQDRARRGNALFFHSELPAENHQTAHHDKICNPGRKRLDQDIGKKMPMDLIPVLLQRQKKRRNPNRKNTDERHLRWLQRIIDQKQHGKYG